MSSDPASRHAPRVALSKPGEAHFDGVAVLVLDLGLGGAGFEHQEQIEVGRRGLFEYGPLAAQVMVRRSVLTPTKRGLRYHVGASFIELDSVQSEELFRLLIDEAQLQAQKYEGNTGGAVWGGATLHRSVVASRFITLHLTSEGWNRDTSTDPNQPLDGVTVFDDTPRNEIRLLCDTYRDGNEGTRELLRRTAMLVILERLRG